MYGQSIILHELVHFPQNKNGWSQTACTRRTYRETEAYEIQDAYLASRAIDTSLQSVMSGWHPDFCPDNGPHARSAPRSYLAAYAASHPPLRLGAFSAREKHRLFLRNTVSACSQCALDHLSGKELTNLSTGGLCAAHIRSKGRSVVFAPGEI